MGDLFGHEPAQPRPDGTVALSLTLHRTSAKAWLLSATGRAVDAAWAPFSEATRGEGRDENVWTMPVWLARDRGWV
jgi:hypothetical protein